MYLLAEVFFYAGQRSSLPQVGYRPDAVFDNAEITGELHLLNCRLTDLMFRFRRL